MQHKPVGARAVAVETRLDDTASLYRVMHLIEDRGSQWLRLEEYQIKASSDEDVHCTSTCRGLGCVHVSDRLHPSATFRVLPGGHEMRMTQDVTRCEK